MGAPKDRFSANVIYGDDGTKKLYYYAKALTEYRQNPQQLNPSVDDPHFCELFFVDKVKHIKDTAGGDCLQSYIEVGSDNAALHNPLRHSKVAACEKINNVLHSYIQLNDGGLNTKPYIYIDSINLCAQNMLVFSVTYRNAYYDVTTGAVATLELLQQSGGQWVVGLTETAALASLPVAAKANGTGFSFLIEDKMIALAANVGDKVRVTINVTNNEGTYTSNSATDDVTERIETLDVYKINSISDNPYSGVHYKAILKKEYYATDIHGDPLVQGDEGYPNLINLFAARPETLQQSGAEVDTTVFFNGQAGSAINRNILTAFLPDGIYYGFPPDWPGNYQADPPAADKIIFIRTNQSLGAGQAYKWANSAYTPPTPVITAVFSDADTAINTSGDYISYAYDYGDYYDVFIYPLVSVTGKGSGTVTVEVVRVVDGEDDYTVYSKDVDVDFGSSTVETTKQIPISTGEEVPIDHLELVEDICTKNAGYSTYEYEVRVSSSNPSISGATYPIVGNHGTVDIQDLVTIK